jgi:hypothetical protein
MAALPTRAQALAIQSSRLIAVPAPEASSTRWRLDLRTLTQADFDAIAQELNERPRQTLGFKTPSQALAEVLR